MALSIRKVIAFLKIRQLSQKFGQDPPITLSLDFQHCGSYARS